MARQRVRRARAKVADEGARLIADGVFHTARELGRDPGRRFMFPRPVQAPLVYVAELVALGLAKEHKLELEPADVDALTLYVLQGMQVSLRGLVGGFDAGVFDQWRAAAKTEGIL